MRGEFVGGLVGGYIWNIKVYVEISGCNVVVYCVFYYLFWGFKKKIFFFLFDFCKDLLLDCEICLKNWNVVML